MYRISCRAYRFIAEFSVFIPAGLIILFTISFLFLDFESFRPRLDVEFNEKYILTSSITWLSLARSGVLAFISSVIIFSTVEFIARGGIRAKFLFIGLFAVYAIDPVSRIIGFRNAVGSVGQLFYKGGFIWIQDLILFYLTPVIALSINYAPVFAVFRFFESRSPEKKLGFCLSKRDAIVFRDLPEITAQAPFSISFLFFIIFFDPWVMTIVGGKKVNYWGPLIIDRIQQGRDVEAALLMALLGFLIVILVYMAVHFIGGSIDKWIQTQQPVFKSKDRVFDEKRNLFESKIILVFMEVVLLALFISSLIWLLTRAIYADFNFEGIMSTLVVGVNTFGIVLLVSISGLWLGGLQWSFFERIKGNFNSILVGWLILALAPEITYIIASAFMTGSGIITPSRFYSSIIMLSFCAPIVGLIFMSYFSGSLSSKGFFWGSVLRGAPWRALLALRSEHRDVILVSLLFVAWIISENVLLLSFTLGPGGEMASPWIYGHATRGISPNDAASIISLTLSRVGIAWLIYIVVKEKVTAQVNGEGNE